MLRRIRRPFREMWKMQNKDGMRKTGVHRGESMITEQAQEPNKFNDTADPETTNHYIRPKVMNIITKISDEGTAFKAGNGDFHRWYKKDGKLFDLSNKKDYSYLISHYRSLYWTLNFFEPETFKRKRINDEDVVGTREETVTYTLGIDIDHGHGTDIHTPYVKKAVEDMAAFFVQTIQKSQPKSVHAAYSGGGIYIYIHHRIWDDYFKKAEDQDLAVFVLTETYNRWVADKEDEFFRLHPNHRGKTKADALNNAKRVFKTILSIHKKLPYAVIPLNTEDIKIDFEAAKLPLKTNVINQAEEWYKTFDEVTKFQEELKPYYDEAIKKYERKQAPFKEIKISQTALKNIDKFPPCINNILNAQSMPAGKTRATAIIATFLGQAGWEKNEAHALYLNVVNNLHADTSNIFGSFYQIMNCPNCKTIKTTGGGFPNLSMGETGICKPDSICKSIRNPIQYLSTQSDTKTDTCGSCVYKPRGEAGFCKHKDHRKGEKDQKYKNCADDACKDFKYKVVKQKKEYTPHIPTQQDIPFEDIGDQPLTINELIDEFKKVLYVEEDINISIPLAFAISNHSFSDPDALGIIGPSGSGKTEIVRSLGDTENQYVYPISSLTSRTFVSGYKDAQDLAPRLQKRLITIKDFTSILSKNKDEVSGIFADIRDILDGYIQKAYGSEVGKKEFKDIHSSFLFACTNAIEKYYSVYSVLGQRLVFFRPLTDARKARLKAMENAGKETEIRKKHHALTMRLINCTLAVNRERVQNLTQEVSPKMQERIGKLCEFLAIIRTHIDRDFKGDMASLPEPELPTRLTKTLCKIVDAHSVLYNRSPSVMDEITAVRLIYDNIPTERTTVLKALCAFDGMEKTSTIAIAAKIPTSMCSRILNDLAALGIVTRWDKAALSSNSDEWQIVEEAENDELQFKTSFLLISNYNLWPIVSEMLKGENQDTVYIDTINKVYDVYKNNNKIINELKTKEIISIVYTYLAESHPSTYQDKEPPQIDDKPCVLQYAKNITTTTTLTTPASEDIMKSGDIFEKLISPGPKIPEHSQQDILKASINMIRKAVGFNTLSISNNGRDEYASNLKVQFDIQHDLARDYVNKAIETIEQGR